MRRKIIEQDGETFTISPLTLAQLEEFGAPLSNEKREIKIRAFDLVCHGLNNALANGAPRWDHDRIRQELDLIMFKRLQDEILEFSGLPVPKSGEPSAGEMAASGAPSATSGAESSP